MNNNSLIPVPSKKRGQEIPMVLQQTMISRNNAKLAYEDMQLVSALSLSAERLKEASPNSAQYIDCLLAEYARSCVNQLRRCL